MPKGTIVKQVLQEFAELLTRFETEAVIQAGPAGWKVDLANREQTMMLEVTLSASSWTNYQWEPMKIAIDPNKLVEFLRVIPRGKEVVVEYERAAGGVRFSDRLVIGQLFDTTGSLRRVASLEDPKDIQIPKTPSPPVGAIEATLDIDLLYKFAGAHVDGRVMFVSNGRDLVLGGMTSSDDPSPVRYQIPPSALQELQARGVTGPYQRVVVLGKYALQALKSAGAGRLRFSTDNIVEIEYDHDGIHAHWFIAPFVSEEDTLVWNKNAEVLLKPMTETVLARFTLLSDVLKPIVEAQVRLLEQINIAVSQRGWNMVSVDGAHVAILELALDNHFFSVYSPPAEEQQLAVNSEELWEFIRKRPRNTDIEIRLTENHLIADSEGETARLERQQWSDPKPPKMKLTHLAEVPLKLDILKYLKDVAALTDHVMFLFHPNALILGAFGETDENHLKIPQDYMQRYTAPSTIINAYNLNYLAKILNKVKAKNVTVRDQGQVPARGHLGGSLRARFGDDRCTAHPAGQRGQGLPFRDRA